MMNRRAFLGVLGVAAPAAAVASRIGLWEKVLAWIKAPAPQPLSCVRSVALQLEKIREQMPVLYDRSLYGIPYFQNTSTTGEFMGISRHPARAGMIKANDYWRQDLRTSKRKFRMAMGRVA